MEESEDWQSLSVDQKLIHKSWRARLCAYEEVVKQFKASPSAEILRERFDDMRKTPLETNIACLEAALTALQSYIEACENVAKLRATVLPNLIEKCLGAMKPNIREKALGVLLEFVAADDLDPILNELLNHIGHKQPKIVQAVIHAIAEIISNFGCTMQNAKPILKEIPKAFRHPDGQVRNEASNVLCEIARWTNKDIISVCFAELKPVQVKELQEALARISGDKPSKKRFRRGETPNNPSDDNIESLAMEDNVNEGTIVVNQTTDPYETFEAIPVLDKIDESLLAKAESSVWKERKEALDAILQIVSVPKIAPEPIGALITTLVKRIGDVNINVAITASQTIEAIVRGLRGHLALHRKEICFALLERSREKNKNALVAIQKALEGLIFCFSSNLWDWIEEYQAFLKHKNPQIRTECTSWMRQVLIKNGAMALEIDNKNLRTVMSPIIPLLDDASPEVREAALEYCAVAYNVFGQRAASKWLEPLDKSKVERIKELSLNFPIATIKPVGDAPVGPSVAKANTPTKVNVSKLNPQVKKAPISNDKPCNVEEPNVSPAACEISLNSLVPGLKNPSWRIRKEALDAALKIIQRGSEVKLAADEFIVELRARFSDTNKNLIVQSLDVLAGLIDVLGDSFHRHAKNILSQVITCLGDNKLQIRQSALNVLAVAAAKGNLSTLMNLCGQYLLGESVLLRRELLTFLATQNFSNISKDEISSLALSVTKCLNDKTAEVRKSSGDFLLVVLKFVPVEHLLQLCAHENKNSPILQTIMQLAESRKADSTEDSTSLSAVDPVHHLDSALESNHHSPLYSDCLYIYRMAGEKGCLSVEGLMNETEKKEVLRAINVVFGLKIGEDEFGRCLDAALRIISTILEDNPLVKPEIMALDTLERVLCVCDEADWRLSEENIVTIVTPLARYGGMEIEIVDKTHVIFRQLCRVFPASKLFGHLMKLMMEQGKSVNFRILLEIHHIIARSGRIVVQPAKHVPQFVGVLKICSEENKKLLLDIFSQLYKIFGASEIEGFIRPHLSDYEFEQLKRDLSLRENSSTTLLSSIQSIPSLHRKDDITNAVTLESNFPMNVDIIVPTFVPEKLSADVEDSLDGILQQISSGSDVNCLTALQTLEELFKDSQFSIAPSFSRLIQSLAGRLHDCIDSANDSSSDFSLKDRLCHQVTNTLVLLVNDHSNLKFMNPSAGSILLRITIESLIAPNLAQLNGHGQIQRTLNILLVKSLASIPAGISFPALIRLLDERCSKTMEFDVDRYIELIMKCLWKLTKQLGKLLEGNEIDVPKLLQAVEEFFNHHPPLVWKSNLINGRRNGDLPYRTIKTIIHEIVSSLRERLVPLIRNMPGFNHGFTFLFIKTMLQAGNIDVSDLVAIEDTSQKVCNESEPIPSDVEIELKVICNKICSTPDTRTGLQDLSNLIQRYPNEATKIDAYLSSLGAFFYKYIKRNLSQTQESPDLRLQHERLDVHRRRLAQFKGNNHEDTDAGDEIFFEASRSKGSLVQNRLESPVAKAQIQTTAPSNNNSESTIKSLKERLALLRHGVSRERL